MNDQIHREDGPAVEKADGHREWWVNGQLHREDGPAVEEADGTKAWFRNGLRHREDGPAVEEADGTREWLIEGLKITQAQFDALPRDAEGRLHGDTGPLGETEEVCGWFWHGELVTEAAFRALRIAEHAGLADTASTAPQRSRRRAAQDSI